MKRFLPVGKPERPFGSGKGPNWITVAAIGLVAAAAYAVWQYETVPSHKGTTTFAPFHDERNIDWNSAVNASAGTPICSSYEQLYRLTSGLRNDCFFVDTEAKVLVLFNGPAGADRLRMLSGAHAGQEGWTFQVQLSD